MLKADQLFNRRSHGMVAAVNVYQFSGSGRPPVGEHANYGPSDGLGVGRLPTQRRLASPLAFDLLEAR